MSDASGECSAQLYVQKRWHDMMQHTQAMTCHPALRLMYCVTKIPFTMKGKASKHTYDGTPACTQQPTSEWASVLAI
jgi:hypothetical protein